MSKLTSLLALAAITALLAGCASAPDEEPAAAPGAAAATASASWSATAKPSVSPVATPGSTPAAEPVSPETSPSVPAPVAAPPAAPPVEPAAAPETPAAVPTIEAEPAPEVAAGVVVTPHPEWRAETATATQGSSLIVNGSGYQPGQKVFIGLGIAQSDGFVMEDQVAVADAAGAYSFTITIGADLPPMTYAVLTYVTDYGLGGPAFEATKRYAVIDVVAP